MRMSRWHVLIVRRPHHRSHLHNPDDRLQWLWTCCWDYAHDEFPEDGLVIVDIKDF